MLTFVNFSKKDSRKGGREQAKGVMKTKRPARNVPQAERIRAVKLASVAMTRKLVKLVSFLL